MSTYTDNNPLMRTSGSYVSVGLGGQQTTSSANRASSDDGSSKTSSSLSKSNLKSSGKMSGKFGGAERIKEKIAQKWEARNQRTSLFQAWQKKLPTLERDTTTCARPADSFDGFAVKC